MDYVKQMNILRARNAELSEQNKKYQIENANLSEQVDILKKEIQEYQQDREKEMWHRKNLDDVRAKREQLDTTMMEYDSLIKQLKNIKIEYSIKIDELKELLNGFSRAQKLDEVYTINGVPQKDH